MTDLRDFPDYAISDEYWRREGLVERNKNTAIWHDMGCSVCGMKKVCAVCFSRSDGLHVLYICRKCVTHGLKEIKKYKD